MITNLLTHTRNGINEFINDSEYKHDLIQFALPIGIQNLVMSSLNMVAVVLIGQLGEAPLAAVGLANQVFFLLQLVLYGINTGSAIFIAQLWGKRDISNIRKVLSLALLIGILPASFFFAMARFAPALVLGIYSKDPSVIALGSEYLKVFAPGYLCFAVSFGFAIALRSIGLVRIPMLISAFALAVNAMLSYVLIFGKLGFPAMGVRGAALAGLAVRILELGLLLGFVYSRRMPLSVSYKDFLSLDLGFFGRIFKPILPVILNETFWSLGVNTYYIVYARINTDSIAAMNIFATIENLALVMVFGIANGTAVMVGNRIGAGNEKRAFEYAVRSYALAIALGILIGSQLVIWSPAILSLYKVSPQVIDYAHKALIILGMMLWVRGTNAVLIVGILRGGGDTYFSFMLDGLVIWLVGVPSAFFTAFVLRWPVYWVYLAILSEEVVKYVLGSWRLFSKRWIHNMTQAV